MAKYFDLRRAEKKTSGILADTIKKKGLDARRKPRRQPGLTS